MTSTQPVEILRQLIRIPSVTPMMVDADPDICCEHRMTQWLVDFFETIGAPYEQIEAVPAFEDAPSRHNVVARYQAGDDRPTVLLDAHQDTVPVIGMLAPFDPMIRNGKIHGRGACDVKGGMAAMLSAFARLIDERPATAANVILSCTCDEEATALGVRDLITYWRPGANKSHLLNAPPAACIVAEPTDLNVVIAHRGVLRFRVCTHGTACHSSDPSRGANAIYAMTPVLNTLETLANRMSSSRVDSLCGRPTLSVGLISGGTAVNIVPARCVIDVDRRLVPGEEPDQVWVELEQVLAGHNALCEPPWLAAPPLDTHRNQELSERLLANIRKVGGVEAQPVGVPYCTNASTIAAAGIPAVVFGPGSIAQAHTENEFIDIAQLETAAEVYFQFCCSFDS